MLHARAYASAPLFLLLALAPPAAAGVNPGFTVSVDGATRVDNPAIGQTVTVALRVAGTTQVKGAVARVQYDTAVVAFREFVVGDLIPGSIPLSSQSGVGDDGLRTVEGGSTLLGSGVTRSTTGGLLGTFTFEVVGAVGEEGSHLSVAYVEVNTSAADADEDVLTFAPGAFGVTLALRFPNRIFNADVKRRFDGAAVSWESRFAGLDDSLRVRVEGGEWIEAVAEHVPGADSAAVAAARALRVAGVDASARTAALDSVLAAAGLGPPYADGFLDSLFAVDRVLRTRRHVVSLSGLAGDTQYEYEARSTSLRGERSNRLTGFFRTRLAPDLRPAVGTDLDLQATATTATATWFTNRPADTRLRITDTDSVEVATIGLDPSGALVHAATIGGLLPDTEYLFAITSRLVDADDLVSQGLMTQADITVVKTGRFRTSAGRQPVRLLGPPVRVVSAESAVIQFRLNQIAVATVDYGAVGDSPAPVYDGTISSGDILTTHSLTLSDLDASTLYRYRITAVTPDGDSLSTDPSGNEQWSQDLTLRTSAAGDTLPPVIVEGPFVIARDVLAVVRFATDVETRATVFFGTRGGTYGTADEFEIADQAEDGGLRLSQEHAIVVSGLDAGVEYDYGIVVEATNGQTASFEPNRPAGKPARAAKALAVLQPPGGLGSFTTSGQPDTQFPVILTGPTVTSKTSSTAVVEWMTDEPADSDVRFGVGSPSSREGSGVSLTRHRIALSNLTAATSYTFVAASTDAAGNGAVESVAGVFATDPELDLTAPQIASGPQIVYRNDEAATIRWTTDEEASAEVDFGTTAALGFIRGLGTTGRVHEVTLTNLTPATTYHYRVASSDLSNNGPTRSAVLTFTSDAAPDGVAPVLGAVGVAASDSVTILTWGTDELADSFVDYGTVSGILDVTAGDAEDVTAHEVTLTNLVPATTYFYRVGSIDRAGNGPTTSAEGSFTTLGAADAVAPTAPAGVTGTTGSRLVRLAWTANSEIDLSGYNLYRRSGGGEFAAIASRLATPSYTDLAVVDDVAYEYRVTAIDRTWPANESAPSATVALTPTSSASPTAPAGLIEVGSGLQPTLRFSNAEPFRTGASLTYTIQVSTRDGFTNVTASESGVAAGSGTTSWPMPRSLEDGTTYYWRVRADEEGLPGPFSETRPFRATSAPLLLGDFDDSGGVDFDDFFLFVDAFGRSAASFARFDLNGSGGATTIDFDDFFLFVDGFGSSAGKRSAAGPEALAAYPLDEGAAIHLRVDGQSGARPGERVHLHILVDGAADLKACGLAVTWDPALLAFVEAVDGDDRLLLGGDGGLFQVLEERPGLVQVGAARTGEEPVSGSGLLAQLSFRLLDPARAHRVRFELPQTLLSRGAGDVRRAPAVAAARLVPQSFALGQAYPNPFNPATHIDFALAVDGPASLVVYDVLGRRVRTLMGGEELRAGYYAVVWDGRDGDGRAAGSGLYFYRLTAPGFTRTGKMLLLE